MISQFFVLSGRGDTIVSKDLRGDIPRDAAEIFFRQVKEHKDEAPPAFNAEGINFVHLKRNGLWFMVTSKYNVSPGVMIELMDRIIRIIKDYCGVLTEEAIRKNFILVYELMDEMLDFGYPQATSTDALKMYIHNEPIAVAGYGGGARGAVAGAFNLGSALTGRPKTQSAVAVQKPISLGGRRSGKDNEIFVDIVERLTVLFNSNGYILNSMVDGQIQMKSYLTGNPPLMLALNEDLVIGGAGDNGSYGGVVVDDASFHECVQLDQFDTSRTLTLVPPDGEFVAMNYRMTGEFRAPFRVFPFVEEVSPYRIEFVLKVRADIPASNHGTHVTVRFPVPRTASSVTPEVGKAKGGAAGAAAAAAGGGGGPSVQAAEYDEKKREVVWQIRRLKGGSEETLRCRIGLSAQAGPAIRKELGPVSLSFEIPMYSVSQLQVRYLRVDPSARIGKISRWVRYITQSTSYECRL